MNFCRYYRGEAESPYKDGDKTMCWDYERCWVKFNTNKDKDTLARYIGEYASVGLSLFSITDDIPVSLKALLFNRFVKGSNSMIDAVEPFKKFYSRMYK